MNIDRIYFVFDDLTTEPFLVTLDKDRALEVAKREMEKFSVYTYVEEYTRVEHTDCFYNSNVFEFWPNGEED